MPNNNVVITIEAKSTKAITEIGRLVTALEKLPDVMQKITASVRAVSSSITKLNTKLDSTARSATNTGTSLATANKSITSFNRRVDTTGRMALTAGASLGVTNVSLKSVSASSMAAAGSLFKMSSAATFLKLLPVLLNQASLSNFRLATSTATAAKSFTMLSFARGFVTTLGTTFATAFNLISTTFSTVRTGLISGVNGLFAGFGRLFTGVRSGAMAFLGFNDALRIATQGITTLGRSMLFFLSLPLLMFFLSLSRTAIDFEDAMIRVQKTTNLTSAETEILSERLRSLALQTKSSHVELAGIAEIIGQLGVTGYEAIFNLTQIFELLGVTTDLTSQDVANSLGKIANAFQWNLNASSDEVFRLANVINMLENTTASSAGEIITSLSKWAQAAGLLKVSAADAAALSASMVSLGLTEEEAGTALKRMSTQLIGKADAVAEAMKANEKYSSTEKVLNAINEDAVTVWLDVASAAREAADAGNNAEALFSLIEMADERGGRALAALASNIEMVTTNIANARAEWERATSLVNEYNRAMSSTKSQLAVFKNNINDVGITIGDALLPVLNRLISVAIPGLKAISAWFRALKSDQQVMYIAFVLAAIAAGPLLLIFGQMVHAINLVLMGFGLLVKASATVLIGVSKLAPLFTGLIRIVLGWPGAIILASVAILKVLSSLGVNVSGFFLKIAEAASSWGKSLMETYGGGLVAGFNFVLQVISRIAQIIASFFEAHSPPKVGPLSTIDKWGSALLRTFLKGFNTGDFSILEDVGKRIENSLTRGKADDALAEAIGKYAKARVKLSELISKFNQTGLVDTSLLSEALDGTGELKGDLTELVKLQMKFNSLQQQLADIEAKRKGLLKTYDQEIEAIGASSSAVEDKVEAIRNSMRSRDSGLAVLYQEEESINSQTDATKEQLDWQKGLVDALTEQDDIMSKIEETFSRIASSLGGAASALEDFELPSGGDVTFTEDLEKATEEIQNFIDRMSEGELIFQGLKDGFGGLAPLTRDAFSSDEAYNYYLMLYNLGTTAADLKGKFDTLVTGIVDAKDSVMGFIDNLKNFDLKTFIDSDPMVRSFIENMNTLSTNISGLFSSFESFKTGVTGIFDAIGVGVAPLWDKYIKPVVDKILNNPVVQELLGWLNVFTSGFQVFIGMIVNGFSQMGAFGGIDLLWASIQNLWTALTNLWTVLQPIATFILEILVGAFFAIGMTMLGFFAGVWGAIGGFIGGIIAGLSALLPGIINIITGIINVVAGFVGTLIAFISALFTGNWQAVIDNLIIMGQGLLQIIVGVFMSLVGILSGVVLAIINLVVGFVKGIILFFTNLYNQLVGHSIIPDMLNKMKAFFVTILSQIVNAVKDKVASIVQAVKDKVSSFINLGRDMMEGLKNGIMQKITSIIAAVKGAVQGAIDAAKKLLGIKSPSKVFKEMGVFSVEGYYQGVVDEGDKFASLSGRSLATSAIAVAPSMASLDSVTTSFNSPITLQFGRDSVRSDNDIKEIANVVERIINKKIQDRKPLGYGSVT